MQAAHASHRQVGLRRGDRLTHGGYSHARRIDARCRGHPLRRDLALRPRPEHGDVGRGLEYFRSALVEDPCGHRHGPEVQIRTGIADRRRNLYQIAGQISRAVSGDGGFGAHVAQNRERRGGGELAALHSAEHGARAVTPGEDATGRPGRADAAARVTEPVKPLREQRTDEESGRVLDADLQHEVTRRSRIGGLRIDHHRRRGRVSEPVNGDSHRRRSVDRDEHRRPSGVVGFEDLRDHIGRIHAHRDCLSANQ